MATVSCGTSSERFRFIDENREHFGVKYMCTYFGVSRSGYYAWRSRKKPNRAYANEALLCRIGKIHAASRETYGSPRVHAALRKGGLRVGRTRVERLMREAGIKARTARIYRRLAGLHRFYDRIRNRRVDGPAPSAINKQWAADLTYLRVGRTWRYLAVVIDLYSRRIVGWSMGKQRTVQLTGAALMMAIRKRRPSPGLLFHTDRGIEYRSYAIQDIHKRYGIEASMNRPGQCTDNAEVESFFHTLKGETVRGREWECERELRQNIAGYIQHFYNRTRLHSSLGYCSPAEYKAISA
jgi:putative transposase